MPKDYVTQPVTHGQVSILFQQPKQNTSESIMQGKTCIKSLERDTARFAETMEKNIYCKKEGRKETKCQEILPICLFTHCLSRDSIMMVPVCFPKSVQLTETYGMVKGRGVQSWLASSANANQWQHKFFSFISTLSPYKMYWCTMCMHAFVSVEEGGFTDGLTLICGY